MDYLDLDEMENGSQPRQYVGRSLRGWSLEKNRQPLDGQRDFQYPSAEAAKMEADRRSTKALNWVTRATNPEGDSFFQGSSDESRDLWYVEPIYIPRYEAVPRAIRPLPHSPYYAAPYAGLSWDVWREGIGDHLELHDSGEKAVQAASRLALGLKNEHKSQVLIYILIGLVVTLTLAVAVGALKQ